MINKIKKLLPQPVKNLIGHYTSKSYEILKTSDLYIRIASVFCRKQDWYGKKGRKIFLINTPTHPNLGDQAIAQAEVEFIVKHFPDDILVELHDDIFFDQIYAAKKHISHDDIIMCHGGGNMGTDYYWCEKVRQTAIKLFPNNKIIIFPQTIFYSESKSAQRALEKSCRIYNQHAHILICARERASYDILTQKYSGCKIALVPDIVLLMKPDIKAKRENVLLCFRQDREKAISDVFEKELVQKAEESGDNVIISDTVLTGKLAPCERKAILREKLCEFASSKVVITDRLHGMIFAYITNTPCIVLPNYNHKVEGTYGWIEKYDGRSVKLIREIDEFEEAYGAIDKNGSNDSSWVSGFFETIIEYVNSNSPRR